MKPTQVFGSQDAGATAEGAIRDELFGRIAQLADPFGHGLCLIELSPAGYDAIAKSSVSQACPG